MFSQPFVAAAASQAAFTSPGLQLGFFGALCQDGVSRAGKGNAVGIQGEAAWCRV